MVLWGASKKVNFFLAQKLLLSGFKVNIVVLIFGENYFNLTTEFFKKMKVLLKFVYVMEV